MKTQEQQIEIEKVWEKFHATGDQQDESRQHEDIGESIRCRCRAISHCAVPTAVARSTDRPPR